MKKILFLMLLVGISGVQIASACKKQKKEIVSMHLFLTGGFRNIEATITQRELWIKGDMLKVTTVTEKLKNINEKTARKTALSKKIKYDDYLGKIKSTYKTDKDFGILGQADAAYYVMVLVWKDGSKSTVRAQYGDFPKDLEVVRKWIDEYQL